MHTMKRDTYRIKEEVQIGGTKEISAHYSGPKSLRKNWTQGLGGSTSAAG